MTLDLRCSFILSSAANTLFGLFGKVVEHRGDAQHTELVLEDGRVISLPVDYQRLLDGLAEVEKEKVFAAEQQARQEAAARRKEIAPSEEQQMEEKYRRLL